MAVSLIKMTSWSACSSFCAWKTSSDGKDNGMVIGFVHETKYTREIQAADYQKSNTPKVILYAQGHASSIKHNRGSPNLVVRGVASPRNAPTCTPTFYSWPAFYVFNTNIMATDIKPPCVVCAYPASSRCAGCQKVNYCSKAHQKHVCELTPPLHALHQRQHYIMKIYSCFQNKEIDQIQPLYFHSWLSFQAWPTHKRLCKIYSSSTPPSPDTYCGLCGSTSNLTKTPCCNRSICNDTSAYQPGSFSSVSCSRNHARYTLCGFHHSERHGGKWQGCGKCVKRISSKEVLVGQVCIPIWFIEGFVLIFVNFCRERALSTFWKINGIMYRLLSRVIVRDARSRSRWQLIRIRLCQMACSVLLVWWRWLGLRVWGGWGWWMELGLVGWILGEGMRRMHGMVLQIEWKFSDFASTRGRSWFAPSLWIREMEAGLWTIDSSIHSFFEG